MEVSFGPVGQTAAEFFQVPPGGPKVTRHALWLGHLKGSWYDIGVQYGEKAGHLMPYVVDHFLNLLMKGSKTGPLSKEHIVQDCYLYEKYVELVNPDLLDFAHGISVGSSKELARCTVGGKLSDYEKVLFINTFLTLMNNHPSPEEHDAFGALYQPLATVPGGAHDCTGLAVLPAASEDKKTHVTHNIQNGYGISLYMAIYAATPPHGNTFWSNGTAGMISYNMVTNDKGVSISHHGGGQYGLKAEHDTTFGLNDRFTQIDAIVNSNTMEEAVEYLTMGPAKYRHQTGRKTLLRDAYENWLVVSPGKACLIEASSRRYGIRRPGDFGEKDFIVCANHQLTTCSYNEENELTDFGMANNGGDVGMPWPKPGTCTRFWSMFWPAIYNYGRINVKMLQSPMFVASHSWYDRNGNRRDFIADGNGGWLPAQYAADHSTICGHSGGYPEKYRNELPNSKIATLEDRTVRWTLGRPCTWEGQWDSVQLT